MKITVLVRMETEGEVAGSYEVVGIDGMTIGRNPQNDLVLADGTVSREHARLRVEQGVCILEDVGSRTGTWLDGVLLEPRRPYPVEPTSSIAIAGARLSVEIDTSDITPSERESTFVAVRSLVERMSAGFADRPRLRILDGNLAGQRFEIGEIGAEVRLGRGTGFRRLGARTGSPVCEVGLDDRFVSRQHVRVWREKKGVFVEPLPTARNPVRVDRDEVTGRRRLRDGEVLGIGETRIAFDDPSDRPLPDVPPPVDLSRPVTSAPPADESSSRNRAPGAAPKSPASEPKTSWTSLTLAVGVGGGRTFVLVGVLALLAAIVVILALLL